MTEHEPHDGYRGPAEISVGTHPPVTVEIHLAGSFEPISGRYVWHGRIRSLTERFGAEIELPAGTLLQITTDDGTATARISGVDLWGSHLVDGVSAAPFSRF